MPKQIDLEETIKQIDEALKPVLAAREHSHLARIAIEVGRPMALWRVKERNRGTSPNAVLEGICEEAGRAVASELFDIEGTEQEKELLANIFLSGIAQTIADHYAKASAKVTIPETEISHA